MSDIARITGRAFQDDESFEQEGDFIPERDQFYFELQKGDNTFLIGYKDILKCIRLLEKIKEIPEIGADWWQSMVSLYGDDVLMLEYMEKE